MRASTIFYILSLICYTAVFLFLCFEAKAQKTPNTHNNFTFETGYYKIFDTTGKEIKRGTIDKEIIKHGDTLQVYTWDQHFKLKLCQIWKVGKPSYEPVEKAAFYSGQQLTHWDGIKEADFNIDWWLQKMIIIYFDDRTELYYGKHPWNICYILPWNIGIEYNNNEREEGNKK